MFSKLATIRHKLASIVRKTKRTKHSYLLQAKDQGSPGFRMSSSPSSNDHVGSMDAYSPGPPTAINKTYRAIECNEEDGHMSSLDLEDGPYRSAYFGITAASSTTSPSGTSQQHTESPVSLEAELVGPVIVRHQGRHYHALLLTPETYEAVQDITRIKRELHELEVSIGGLAEQAINLRFAKDTLESHRENAVPGACLKQGDGGETARRQLLMPAIRKRLGICERSLHNLDEQRQIMTADLDVSHQKIMSALAKVAGIVG